MSIVFEKNIYRCLTYGKLVGRAIKVTILAATVLLLSFLTPSIHAAEAPDSCHIVIDSIEVQVLFPIGKSEIDLSYQHNGENLSNFIERLKKADADPSICPGRIHIVGYVSPDGGYQFNQRLAEKRANNLASYLRTRTYIPDSLITIESAGIDWHGLDCAVGESSLRNKAQVQYIIRHEPEFTYNVNGALVRSRKQILQNLDGGRTWSWMMENLYPALRSSASVVCYIEKVNPEQTPIVDSSDISDLSDLSDNSDLSDLSDNSEISDMSDKSELSDIPNNPEDYLKYPIFALRTNMLVPFLNVGVEVPVAKHWSIGADYYYPWIWPAKNNKNCFELIFVSAEARYWFNPNKNQELQDRNYLLGHSVGVYGAWGYYDVERNWHGHQGHAWSAGVDYMFAIPIAKNRLHLEFQLALGVIWSPGAQPYNVYESGGHLIKEHGHKKNFTYFGPTKVGVNLVLPLNRKVKKPAVVMP